MTKKDFRSPNEERKQEVFILENQPFKSKKLPKKPPYPLPQVDEGAKVYMTLAGRR